MQFLYKNKLCLVLQKYQKKDQHIEKFDEDWCKPSKFYLCLIYEKKNQGVNKNQKFIQRKNASFDKYPSDNLVNKQLVLPVTHKI